MDPPNFDLGPVEPQWEWLRDELARRLAEPDTGPMEAWQVADIGAGWEESGLLSQDDYIRTNDISNGIQYGDGTIADVDFEWLLELLRSTTENVVRAKVMALLGGTVVRAPVAAERRARIAHAVTQFLNSPDDLDRGYAVHVVRTLGL